MSAMPTPRLELPPGLHRRIPFDRYREALGMNISALKEMARSPLHYRHRLDTPRASSALTLGAVAHTAVLEPHRFLAEYALWDERDDDDKVRARRGKAWEAFKASCGSKRIVKAEEYAAAMAMRDAVRDSIGGRYLRKGDPEVSMVWNDGESKRLCKGRIDWLTHVDGIDCLVGLKTARDARPLPFGNQAAKLGYHLQWAFYRDGYTAATGRPVRLVEIVVESAPPHDVVVFVIPSDVIEQGQEEYRECLTALARCETTGEWPGTATEEQLLSLPSWVYDAQDDIGDLQLEQ